MSLILRSLACALALCALFVLPPVGAAEDTSPPPLRDPALVQRLHDILVARLAQPGADPGDWRHHADQGDDLIALFAFVRDEIQHVPYAGLLRGPGGALRSRRANAVDQALLLQAMLAHRGHPTRLVTGTLEDGSAAALVDAYLGSDPHQAFTSSSPEPAERGLDAAATAVATATGIDAQALRQRAEGLRTERSQLAVRADVIARRQVAALRPLVADRLRPRSFAEQRLMLIDRVSEHVWVQVETMEGWMDLDPSHVEADPGWSATAGEPIARGDLPRHLATFTIELQRSVDGQTQIDELVSLSMPVAEFLADPVSFQLVPTGEEAADAATYADMPPAELLDALQRLDRFLPLLRKGHAYRFGTVFDRQGRLHSPTGDARIANAKATGKAISGAFAQALGQDEEDQGPDTRLLALTATLAAIAPDGSERAQRRTIWRRESDRTDAELVIPVVGWQLWLQGEPVREDFLAHQRARWQRDHAASLMQTLTADDSGSMQHAIKNPLSERAPWPARLADLALERQESVQRHLEKHGRRVMPLLDTPVWILHRHRLGRRTLVDPVPEDSPAPAVGTMLATDIVFNDVRFIARAADAAQEAPAAAMHLGAFDTAAEVLLSQWNQPGAHRSTSAMGSFERQRALGTTWGVATGDDAAALAALGISAADQRWIAANTPEHLIVAATADAESDGPWWSIDPRSGMMVGRHHGGMGVEVIEYLAENTAVVGAVLCFAELGIDTAAYGVRDTTAYKTINCLAGIAIGHYKLFEFALVECLVGVALGEIAGRM